MSAPNIFVISSNESKAVVRTLQFLLGGDVTVTPWYQGAFELGGSTLPSLVTNLDNADFAIIVIAPDDDLQSRGKEKKVPRDNVVFEYGMAVGKLGPERCYYVFDSSKTVALPSDLLGVTGAAYDSAATPDLEGALRYPVAQISRQVRKLPPRDKLDPHALASMSEQARFCGSLIGHWWQSITPDDASAISFVRVEPDSATRTLRMWGDAYDMRGEVIAEWETKAVSIYEGSRQIFYIWEGSDLRKEQAIHKGFGEITFRGADSARGSFADINIAEWKSARRKAFEMRRATPAEAQKMSGGRAEVAAQVLDRREELRFREEEPAREGTPI